MSNVQIAVSAADAAVASVLLGIMLVVVIHCAMRREWRDLVIGTGVIVLITAWLLWNVHVLLMVE